MTTYGPASFSLDDRLAAADAVVLVDRAELTEVTTDDLAETPRDLGTFVLHVNETLSGPVDGPVRVVVARDRDGSWPVPPDGPFVALVQSGGTIGTWTLVHNSAFALERKALRFNPTAGCPERIEDDRLVPVEALRQAITERAERDAAYARTMTELEPGSASDQPYEGEMEMPAPSLTPWLPGGRTIGGSPGDPDDARPRARQRRPSK